MKEESKSGKNVIDLSKAFEALRIFRKGFESQPASVQTGILKNVVQRLVIKKNMTIVIEVFGSGPEVIGRIEKNKAAETERSPFLTVSKVVRTSGAISKLVYQKSFD